MTKVNRNIRGLVFAAALGLASAANAGDVVVVMAAGATAPSKDVIANVYLGRSTELKPMDLPESNPARQYFYKKATELDPKNAQAWYLMGAALVGAMEYKKVGDKMEIVVQPGTVEAYQKALELDPKGPYGEQAKQGLDALAQMAPGIDTKTKVKKKS